MSAGQMNKDNVFSSKENKMRERFKDFIVAGDHPCVMAQSIFSQKQDDFHVYDGLGTETTAKEILKDLKKYLSGYDFDSNDFFSFIAKEFEDKLWQQLQHIHVHDDLPWDKKVSSDAQSNNFSFSIAGSAFYLVGMHPGSSRMARRSPFPVLVFNLHWQFEKLREMGAYYTVRNKIRDRDSELQGSVNPMLEDFGKNSEALQYSGRAVDAQEWKCPFHKK